jgi:NAD+ synthase (glutamine-hydrolysing)
MARQLTIVMAQLNLMVGDIHGNTALILDSARQAIVHYHADMIVFPELSLTGYPPEDLLLRPALAGRMEQALQKLCEAGLPITMVIGFPQRVKGNLYNALGVIQDGKLVATYHKQSLPNYQVFDEKRYFTAGDKACLLNIQGVNFAFTICEDLWESAPIRQASQAGAQLLININASPFHTDKLEQRAALLSRRAHESGIAIMYVNQVGGQDELIFDGNSMVAHADGKVTVVGPAFSEALIAMRYDTDQGVLQPMPDVQQVRGIDSSTEERCYQAMMLGLSDYVRKNHFKNVVLGLSGGIDSALTLAVAVDALGADRVTAVMMPFTYTSELSLRLARVQAETLGVRYEVISIVEMYKAFECALAGEFEGLPPDLTEQNIQARCRGVVLMAISNKKGALVLTTGNKSEIAVGYCTLYGDMAGGFNVLKDASKTLVYRLAEFRNREAAERGEAPRIPQDVIERAPSAELAPGQRDDDNLPPYERLDKILAMYIEEDMSAHDIMEKGFDRQEVLRVLRLVDINEYKRRQGPVGIRLTQRAFGRDRRYPITQAWSAED